MLIFSILLVLFISGIIAQMKRKQQIHYAFLLSNACLLAWSTIRLIQKILYDTQGVFYPTLEHLSYIAVCLLPVFLLMIGVVFAKTRIRWNWKYLLVLVTPTISIAVALTNNLHHLFIVKYGFISTEFVYGPYYPIHEFYSYGCILLGLWFLLSFSIKNSGFFSKQSLLITLGIAVPLMVVILSTQKIVAMTVFYENISFSVAMLFFAIAIFKFKLMNVIPIALQKIVDLISDSYIVVNEEQEIIDYNRTFLETFGDMVTIRRKDRLLSVLTSASVSFDQEKIIEGLELSKEQHSHIAYEEHICDPGFDKHFEIEIIPIYSDKKHLGSILLFKDVTEYKRHIEIIKRNQEILMEQERMASLGQMIGGIAHNLKTPIMSLSGGIEALHDLVTEYRESISDPQVNLEDHMEIAHEMEEWLGKMKPYCRYMSDVISAVKGQAVQMNDSSTDKFTVEELLKRIEVLMHHELKISHCNLSIQSSIDPNTEIKGELNNLVQIFDNIIINSIQSYEGRSGKVDLLVSKNEEEINFVFQDYGKGISDDIQPRLFKEMVTTKGKDGTGLGLYMSYSTIKGRFGGNLWFSSKEGEGTSFYIMIPSLASQTRQGGG
jgi:two-component system, NtrC family, sensor histidine kinase HupT/HoxJ